MRILTFDELTPSMHLDRALIHASAFGGGFPERAVDIYRRRASIFSDYVGVFAVENEHVVGQIFSLRLPYAFRDGPGTLTGIAAVSTRADLAHRGVAKRLLLEIHQREREDGIDYAGLWTNRSWIAHEFYEKLGYRDVYSPPWAIHAPVRGPAGATRGVTIQGGRMGDLDELEELGEDHARDRLGFYRRPKGSARAAALAGDVDPTKAFLVARKGRAVMGYAHVDANPFRVICGEMVGRTPGSERALRDAVSRKKPGVPFIFQHSVVADRPDVFRPPEYALLRGGWYGFMGMALKERWTQKRAVAQFATADPRFVCFAGDRF